MSGDCEAVFFCESLFKRFAVKPYGISAAVVRISAPLSEIVVRAAERGHKKMRRRLDSGCVHAPKLTREQPHFIGPVLRRGVQCLKRKIDSVSKLGRIKNITEPDVPRFDYSAQTGAIRIVIDDSRRLSLVEFGRKLLGYLLDSRIKRLDPIFQLERYIVQIRHGGSALDTGGMGLPRPSRRMTADSPSICR